MLDILTPRHFFNLDIPGVNELFKGSERAWDPLKKLSELVLGLVPASKILGTVSKTATLGSAPVFIAAGARVEPGAHIVGPAFIGPRCVVRHGAYIRENVIMLEGSLVGHASEVKNSILLPGAHAPHFNYVGDSILGAHSNLGAGTKLSNLGINSEKDPQTGKRPSITLQVDGETIDTGLSKFGAILGDNVQTGCNSVLNPGCLVGPGTLIYANLSLPKGYHPGGSVIKLRQKTTVFPRR